MPERILLVDDEQEIVEFAGRVLQRLGYETVTATSGEAALALLSQEHFDLLVTDLMMPGMTGLELLAAARQANPHLATVVITGFGSVEMAIKALRAGAGDFVTKPFGMADLRAAVEHALEQGRLLRENARLRALLPLLELNKQSLRQDLPSLLQHLVEIAQEETGADGAALLLLGEDGHTYIEGRLGLIPASCTECENITRNMSASEEARILSPQDAPSPTLCEAMQEHGIASLMCVPLRTPNRYLGVMALTKAAGHELFREADRELASILGSQAAALLENANLVQKLGAWNKELEARVEERTRELRAAQEQLLRAERLATIGKFGASIAHELRNPLGVINNSVYYLKTRLGEADPKVAKHLQIIEREVEAANRIITDIMNFVRVTEVRMEPVDPNALVRQTLERALLPDTVQVQLALTPDLPPVQADADKMHQVFINLINNAVQAMPEGGKLTIATDQQNGCVRFSFSDTGCGIPEENMERIFEPLFTTKAKGIGLGLPLVRMLVEAHRGQVQVASRVGEGTRFTVCLPYQEHHKEHLTT